MQSQLLYQNGDACKNDDKKDDILNFVNILIIDVGDGCWRRNVLLIIIRQWWRFWYKCRAPTCKRCHQQKKSVTNIQKSW